MILIFAIHSLWVYGDFILRKGVNMGVKTENKMAYEPVNKLIIQMSAPPLISMFFQYSYNLVDSMFDAGINEQALAAVSLAFYYNAYECVVRVDRCGC